MLAPSLPPPGIFARSMKRCLPAEGPRAGRILEDPEWSIDGRKWRTLGVLEPLAPSELGFEGQKVNRDTQKGRVLDSFDSCTTT